MASGKYFIRQRVEDDSEMINWLIQFDVQDRKEMNDWLNV